MLHEFLASNRIELIRRCRAKVAKRFEPSNVPEAVDHGVPLFLQQLVDTLREQSTGSRSFADSTPAPAPTEIGRAAALHGTELLRVGYSVDQVVHNYGDVCQAVTELALEQQAPILTDEFRTLNRCLDDAIADAVTAFVGKRGIPTPDNQAPAAHEGFGSRAEKQRRLLDVAIQTFSAIKTGNIGLTGATGTVLFNALLELRTTLPRP